MVAVILILLLLFFLGVYSITISNEVNKATILNLKQADMIRLVNTFNLFNRSLGMTWYISSVQSVFAAVKNSLDCGIDDVEIIGSDVLPPSYWYRYNPDENGKIKDVKYLDRLFNYLLARDSKDPNFKKYNFGFFSGIDYNVNPHVCYPLDEDITELLEKKFNDFKDINDKFQSNGVRIDIDKGSIKNDFLIDPDGINSITIQNVGLTSSGSINDETKNNNEIYTRLPKFFDFSRKLVKILGDFAGMFEAGGLEYPNIISDPKNNFTNYLNSVKQFFFLQHDGELTQYNFRKPEIRPKFEKFELYAADNDAGLFQGSDDAAGLIFHYNLNERFWEYGIKAGICTPASPDYEGIIEKAVKSRWSFTDIDITPLPPSETTIELSQGEVVDLIKAIIQQESGWDEKAVSMCGAAGLMQLMPGTAKDFGLTNIYEDADFTDCMENGQIKQERSAYASRLRNAISGMDNEQMKAVDDRFDPEKAIPAGVAYINKIMDELIEHVKNKDELIKFTIAAYNTGVGNVKSAIKSGRTDEDNAKYDDVEVLLPEQTREYVPAVLGYYLCYGGVLDYAKDAYYYNDKASGTNPERFFKQPFNMDVKAEDYSRALDCTQAGLDYYRWVIPKDMICCGGVLWACNAGIPNLRDDRSLTAGEAITDDNINDIPSQICITNLRNSLINAGIDPQNKKVSMLCTTGGFDPHIGDIPPPQTQCSSYDGNENACNSQTDQLNCYWDSNQNNCFECQQTDTCSTWNTNTFACPVCPIVQNGQTKYCEVKSTFDPSGPRYTYSCVDKTT